MTANELLELELAAKAAGFANWTVANDELFIELGSFRGSGVGFYWNPRKYDKDAFRLAVKLRLTISTPSPWYKDNEDHLYCDASWVGEDGHERWQSVDIKLSEGGDAYAAMRLAITKAAAEIGKNMK